MKKAVNVLLLLSVFISGCLSFSGGNLQNVSVKPLSRPIRIEMTAGECVFSNCFSGDEATDANERIAGHWKRLGVIEEYSLVENAIFTRHADYNISVTVFESTPHDFALDGLLTMFTAGAIPYFTKTGYEVTYVAENTRTGERFKGKLKTHYTQVISLFFLPAVPAAGVGKRKMYKKIAENIYADLQKQGAFL